MKRVVEGEKHFTASVWIVSDSSPKKLLLIHHKKLNKWVQPGGHIERFENPIEAAIREVREETGIDISFLRDGIEIVDEEGTFLPLPAFFMEHTIPPHGTQPRHYHLDCMYVVTIPERNFVSGEFEHEIGWFRKEDALRLPVHGDTKEIISQLLKDL